MHATRNLPPQDDYDNNSASKGRSAGPANMFFSLFEDAALQERYSHIFWMEPDVVPIRRHWLDKLYDGALLTGQQFWVKGSVNGPL